MVGLRAGESACFRQRRGGSSSSRRRRRGAALTRSRAHSAGSPGRTMRKSESSDSITSALSKLDRVGVLAEGQPRAFERAVAPAGSYWCHLRRGNSASSVCIWSASVGDVTVSVSMRRPAPPVPRCARSRGARHRAEECGPRADVSEVCERLRAVGVVERQHRRLRVERRSRRGSRGGPGCPRPSSGRPRGSRPGARLPSRRAASRWRKRAACRE